MLGKGVNMDSNYERIIAMAAAAVAEEMQTDVSCLRIISFREISPTSLDQYIAERKIQYKKYELGDDTH